MQRDRRRTFLVGGAAMLLLAVGLAAAAPSARADLDEEDIDAAETLEADEKVLRRQEREGERVDTELRQLERERDALKADKRTRHPFKVERLLRNEIRQNEAEQGWAKRESRRLDFEIRRQQRDIRRRDGR